MPELSEAQLAALRRTLEESHRELRRLVEGSQEGSRPVSLDQPIGRLSRMDALQQQHMARANLGALQNRLDQVAAALRRLENASYGLCLACEEPIPYGRLAARPESPLCIDCQRGRERP